jgi:molybdopterin-containing oxidoreductase family iron-sulfur binding subunit
MTDINRRSFLKDGLKGGTAVAGAMIAPGITILYETAEAHTKDRSASEKNRWGMVIDTTKCTEECTACTSACRKENNVPLFGDEKIDAHWIRKATIAPKASPEKKISLPLLCNHCEHPPCAHVCPTAATFKRKDGIVLVDEHRCIGCRYCMIACPYKARSFVFKKTENWTNKKVPKRSKGVVEKCNFCVHLVDDGHLPACVTACKNEDKNAMIFGNMNDPSSEISKYIKKHAPKRIREDLGLEPKVYYGGI